MLLHLEGDSGLLLTDALPFNGEGDYDFSLRPVVGTFRGTVYAVVTHKGKQWERAECWPKGILIKAGETVCVRITMSLELCDAFKATQQGRA